ATSVARGFVPDDGVAQTHRQRIGPAQPRAIGLCTDHACGKPAGVKLERLTIVRWVTHDVIVALAALGVAGQVLAALLALVGLAIYHLLVGNGVVAQATSCLISAPGGCGVKWINEFGYVTIPTLALTGFALTFAFLLLAAFEPRYRESHDER